MSLGAEEGGGGAAELDVVLRVQDDAVEGFEGVFERMKHGRDDRNTKALVATAHYLSRVVLAMLKTGEAWREAVHPEKTVTDQMPVGAEETVPTA